MLPMRRPFFFFFPLGKFDFIGQTERCTFSYLNAHFLYPFHFFPFFAKSQENFTCFLSFPYCHKIISRIFFFFLFKNIEKKYLFFKRDSRAHTHIFFPLCQKIYKSGEGGVGILDFFSSSSSPPSSRCLRAFLPSCITCIISSSAEGSSLNCFSNSES